MTNAWCRSVSAFGISGFFGHSGFVIRHFCFHLESFVPFVDDTRTSNFTLRTSWFASA